MKILLSIKPEYADKILSGEKKYEFRRTIFKDQSVKKVVIYATSPIQKVIGEFDIECVISLELNELWESTKHHSGIDKTFYDSYFHGKEIGHAIKVKKTKRYRKHQDLYDYDIKYPPQSFCYLGA
jgi:predicted transcriptional regulator